mgnify:CR=1 FL=1|tara:strand:+ start:9887 stop:10387 length:501 start_codon:yes stop_codon:yes gene_type:complete
MTKSRARTVVMNGFVEYARVFRENMDSNPDYHPTGQYNMNFYPKTQEDLDLFWAAGVEKEFRGFKRLKESSGDGYGIGSYIKLKRDNLNPIAESLGGPPLVVDWSGDALNKGAHWDFEGMGEIGNGSEVRVRVLVYGEGDRTGSRLEKVGVIDLVRYESTLCEDGF